MFEQIILNWPEVYNLLVNVSGGGCLYLYKNLQSTFVKQKYHFSHIMLRPAKKQ